MKKELLIILYDELKNMLRKHDQYDVKNVEETDATMGDLLGLQFDSDSSGGYLYLWSSGQVGFQLLNYDTGDDIIEDSTTKMDEEGIRELINRFDQVLD